MKKVSKKVSSEHEAYSSKGMKAPRPGSKEQGKVKSEKLEPSKGAQPVQGSASVEQAGKETASMSPGRAMGKSGKGKDSRAAAAEAKSKLDVKGPNEGESLSSHCGHGEDRY